MEVLWIGLWIVTWVLAEEAVKEARRRRARELIVPMLAEEVEWLHSRSLTSNAVSPSSDSPFDERWIDRSGFPLVELLDRRSIEDLRAFEAAWRRAEDQHQPAAALGRLSQSLSDLERKTVEQAARRPKLQWFGAGLAGIGATLGANAFDDRLWENPLPAAIGLSLVSAIVLFRGDLLGARLPEVGKLVLRAAGIVLVALLTNVTGEELTEQQDGTFFQSWFAGNDSVIEDNASENGGLTIAEYRERRDECEHLLALDHEERVEAARTSSNLTLAELARNEAPPELIWELVEELCRPRRFGR